MDFEDAQNIVKQNRKSLSQDKLLTFYGLFKQATEGNCLNPKPSIFEFEANAKWNAWKKLKDMDQQRAIQLYIQEATMMYNDMSPSSEYNDMSPSEQGAVFVSTNNHRNPTIQDSDKNLFDWIRENNLQKIKTIPTQVLATTTDKDGMNALHWAADRDRKDLVEYLLSLNVLDVNAQDSCGSTPLHLAAIAENSLIIQLLLDHSALKDIQDEDGETFLSLTSS